MTLLDKGMTPRDFRIDAVDISQRALETAAGGVFGRHSFRGTELGFRDRYFQQVGAGYELAQEVRKCVRFQHGNLHAADLLSEAVPYDFVFCRNVFIYFSAQTVARVVRQFAERMPRPGYLFVGVSESLVRAKTAFELEEVGGAFVYVAHSREREQP